MVSGSTPEETATPKRLDAEELERALKVLAISIEAEDSTEYLALARQSLEALRDHLAYLNEAFAATHGELGDLLIHIPNHTVLDPYKMKAYRTLFQYKAPLPEDQQQER
jgi:glycerol-3-phosphate O-acyltransferase